MESLIVLFAEILIKHPNKPRFSASFNCFGRLIYYLISLNVSFILNTQNECVMNCHSKSRFYDRSEFLWHLRLFLRCQHIGEDDSIDALSSRIHPRLKWLCDRTETKHKWDKVGWILVVCVFFGVRCVNASTMHWHSRSLKTNDTLNYSTNWIVYCAYPPCGMRIVFFLFICHLK